MWNIYADILLMLYKSASVAHLQVVVVVIRPDGGVSSGGDVVLLACIMIGGAQIVVQFCHGNWADGKRRVNG